MIFNQYEQDGSPSIFNERRNREMKQKIINKILESSSTKQYQQLANPRNRISSLDAENVKINQYSQYSEKKPDQPTDSQSIIKSIQQELKNLNSQISQSQKQNNEIFQLEMKNNQDSVIYGSANKENILQDIKLQSDSKEMIEYKQVSLEKYKQLLNELKGLLQMERIDIIKEIQNNMDQDYEQGIKIIKDQLECLQSKKGLAQQTYNLQKSEIDNLSERKSMLKEDLNGKLMQRAELVAQREYLDEILEEFRQKYKQEIEFIEEENKLQYVINNQNQVLQQLTNLKKQKQQTSQSYLSQIYQKNDQLFDLYQVLCNSYLAKFEQITQYNNSAKNLETSLCHLLNKYNIPAFNECAEKKANRQTLNQVSDDSHRNWVGFQHLNFTDKKKFKDEYFKLKSSHKQRLRIFYEWCENIYKLDTSLKLQISLVKKIQTSPPQKLSNESFPQILKSFCQDKGVLETESEEIVTQFNQYQKIILEQNYLLEQNRNRDQEQMDTINAIEQEILLIQDKKKQTEKELFIIEEEYQQSLISLKQNQQILQQKKAILEHTLYLQADQAFGEYLTNEKQIFQTLEKTYGIKAASQIKKEHHKQFVEKIKETQNKRINQLKKIFSDLTQLNKSIEINLSYVENTLFIELNSIESQLITFRKSLQIKEKELQQIKSQEHEFKLKLGIINEAKNIFVDNISKVESINGSQIMLTQNNEQNNNLKSIFQDVSNRVNYQADNSSRILQPKIQNYMPTERTYYLGNKISERQSLEKGRQYNTIDQIGHKESIDTESYRITDIRNLSQNQSFIDGNKIKSRSMFSTIDCTSIDEQNYEGYMSSNQRNYFQKQNYQNYKTCRNTGNEVIQTKSLDNSRRNSMIPISYNSKRQSLNTILQNQNSYQQQNKPINNQQNYNILQYSINGQSQYQSQNSNYHQNITKQNKINNPAQQTNNILQARSNNLQNILITKEVEENNSHNLKEQLNRFQHKIVKFNLSNTQLRHISILEIIKPLLEGREIYKRIGGNQHGSGQSSINQYKNQYNPFSMENLTPEQCGYVLRVAHLNRHLTKIEFKNYQFGQKGQKQAVHSLDTCISVDHMLRIVVPPTTLDLIKFQKHFDVIKNNNSNQANKTSVDTYSSQLYASITMNTYNTLKQNDQSFANNTNISFSNNVQSNNYFTTNSNFISNNANNPNTTMTNYSNLSMIHDQNLKMEKIFNGNLYPFQIIMDKGNRLDLIAEGYDTYKVWVNCINTLIKHRKALNQVKTKIEFIVL
ncbi:hypothetical protein ABPG72_012519 [Tetrahymena utriculariae]